MTMQIKDAVLYNNEKFMLCDVENENLLPTAEAFDIVPKPASTACIRGYCFRYIVKENLIISDFMVNSENGIYPVVNGTVVSENSLLPYGEHFHVYENVNMPVSYSGRILIADSYFQRPCDLDLSPDLSLYFRRSRSVTVQYYNRVFELEFNEGKLCMCRDLSEKCRRLREAIINNPKPTSGKPSERERFSDDILLAVFGDYHWWMHKETTADLKQADIMHDSIIIQKGSDSGESVYSDK